ncbi:uncharacterized protein BDR25DRAFT_303326 [Lindgomyces ingoldianus]|uniref:Uncharacterized protein n=1 Tax=Lindgomyces ingoldianus TaxID=673940 RepID=A0ACB6QXG5_9PLEO|nr:uncharacterized protein BDR25DRAFT_303326 [Lindgomyces ingoldianus]KAF2471263.1 hypothetical protein BDR25DRAFT_303326 [Lindgomyces ingoldianus]
MADLSAVADPNHTINLTPEEKRAFSYLFQQADTEKLGVITGEVAVKFFERTKLAPAVLGEIWQIADTENRGLLTSSGFCQVLRLIGHYQAGRDPSPELASRPGPLPKFEGLTIPSAPPSTFSPPPAAGIKPQMSGGPVRVPQLTPAKAAEYASLFEKSGAQNGILSGENAKQIFEKARLPNETLGRIWNLADIEQRGALGVAEFIIAMHLLASVKTGAMSQLPNALPAGLYEAASRRVPLPPPGGRPRPDEPIASIPRQFSGAGPQRNQSPMGRPYGTPPQSAQPTGNDWAINAQEKASYDSLFHKVDTIGRGFITGDQAVQFFSDSGLPEDILAAIWDLADINSEGQLSRDEFAVAMYLIRQQRKPGVTLPATLPLNLVPPSMRNQVRPSLPIAAPTQEAPPFVAPQPKSAAEDLFGLDAFSAPAPPQVQQSTGGSGSFGKPFDNDPFSSKTASPTSPHPFQPSPRNPTSTFKPFMPTSSFGQTLTSHSTGASGSSATPSRANPPSAMEDLLGESDPEVNKKLTQETTELANMSNQIGTLRTQMQEVQNKKITTENDLNGASTQKRDLELRLSQFKSQYEQEVKAVKALEDRLATSRNETRKLQQELAMIEGTHQDLQSQHRQVGTALEVDQRENANLKERIRQVNMEIGQLRPQLDKLRSDARQQKGMVAINKKQLATNEGERDKMKSEINDLSKTTEESFRISQGQAPAVASPATSTASHSTNPFFRKSPQPSTDNTMSPSGFSREGPHKDFDNVFGTAFSSHQAPAPPTSFRSESQSQVPTFSAPSGHSVRSSEGPDVPTPSTSPPLSSYQESPRAGEPPAPPESRQFASSFLPLRDAVPRSDSFSSSVKVSAPASRYGAPGNETPTISKASPSGTPVPEKPSVERSDTSRTDTDAYNTSVFDRNLSTSPVASTSSDAQRSGSKAEERRDTFPSFSSASANHDIPGAFPRETSSPLQQIPTGESSLSNQSKSNNPSNRTDPFASAAKEQPRGGASAKVDFDAAFAGFGTGHQFQDSSSGVNGSKDSASKFNKEFPPIEDLAHDEDSDSTSEQGFADNFTSASPQQHRPSVGQNQQPQPQPRPSTGTTGGDSSKDEYFKAPPPTSRLDSSTSGLPSPGAQKSPPTYDQTVSSNSRSGTNQFPPEFGGLLPSRTDPTSPPSAPQSPEKSFSTPAGGQGGALFGGSTFPKPSTTSPPPTDTPSSTVPSDAYHSAVSFGTVDTNKGPSPSTNAPQGGKPSFKDDFDAGFDDLTEAKEADDKADDDFMLSSQHREGFDEFNPVFDSPAASKSNTMASQQTPTGKPHGEDSFSDFEHLSQSFSQPKTQQPAASSSQDWDAIFSSLESPQTEKGAQQTPGELGKSVFDTLDKEDAAGSSSKQPQIPQLSRALSSGTEHDDPILKKLTGMGYPRTDALAALEKFDYDINKAADYLTSGH